MSPWVYFYYGFLAGGGVLLSGLGLWFVAILPGFDRWSTRFFRCYYGILILNCLMSICELTAYSFEAELDVIYWIMGLESFFLSLPLPMLTLYLIHCSGEKARSSRLFHTVICLWIVFLCQALLGQFAEGVATITPERQYQRGPLYPLLLAPVVILVVCNLIGTIRRRNRLSRRTYISFLVAELPITLALFVQLFTDVFPLIDISIVLSGVCMYGLIVSDQIRNDLSRQREIARQQLEIANQRTSIMVLQMRPHFIYNTMTSIYCLCNQDPQTARQVVMDFTTYLRKNFSAVASAAPIPFTSELEHARAYLAVEKAQYEDSLFVEYDTPHTFFRIPPLTLQPIVENAVKHGKDPYAGPFHLTIRTQKTASGSEVVVADNGRGFNHADNGEPHIALKNIQQRLEIMCGGTLEITSREGGGTVVTVTIPDDRQEKA